MLENAGFMDVELVAETGFNSSPVTKGVLLRAVRSEQAGQRTEDVLKESPFCVAPPGFT
jgi:hypothetical protein